MEPKLYTDSWIRQAQQGSQADFNRLVKYWYPRIYNFTYKYFADHDMAMDITQQTFITVHKNLSGLQSVEQFRSWLYRIATNCCHQESRRQKRKKMFSFSFWQRDSDNDKEISIDDRWVAEADVETERTEAAEYVLKALHQLPAEQRVVVIMKEYEGLKFREIAAALDVSENTVKSRMYYGLENMRKQLEKWKVTKDMIYF
ncbi:RNA polymerase sigma factor [Cytophagaceae bacterium DM2B3-1]|uniref:RNA polymerase sigma factor n=1 Tax=Xanthocytophaga flava TaxID=3048013 RepID=A0ABT7CW62_9BACT|nr:RNA polymerase sigma factor [Xanthocytophaga flavus]MDJ1498013.1 RNA polymerase sigma factor [Xanthocytophaga flavus]